MTLPLSAYRNTAIELLKARHAELCLARRQLRQHTATRMFDPHDRQTRVEQLTREIAETEQRLRGYGVDVSALARVNEDLRSSRRRQAS